MRIFALSLILHCFTIQATQINKETVTVLFDDKNDNVAATTGNTVGYIGTVENVGATKQKVIAFKSIPYAQAPIGELRYKVSNHLHYCKFLKMLRLAKQRY